MNKTRMNIPRCILIGLLAGSCCAKAESVVPEQMAYQTVLKQARGDAALQNEYVVSFCLYDLATGGNLLWGERRTVRPKMDDPEKGMVAVLLGGAGGVPVDGAKYTTLSDVFVVGTETDHRYMELHIDGEEMPISPRVQVLVVPYAMVAKSVMDAGNGFTINGDLNILTDTLESGILMVTNGLLDISKAAEFKQGLLITNRTVVTEPMHQFGASLEVSGEWIQQDAATVDGSVALQEVSDFNQGISWETLELIQTDMDAWPLTTTNTAPTDGFLEYQLEIHGKNNDYTGHYELSITAANADPVTFTLKLDERYDGWGDLDWKTTGHLPIAKGEAVCVKSVGNTGNYTVNLYFHPLGMCN